MEEHQQRAHAGVYAGTSETQEEKAERDPRCRGATTSCDISRATESRRMRVDLGGKHLKDGRTQYELLAGTHERMNACQVPRSINSLCRS